MNAQSARDGDLIVITLSISAKEGERLTSVLEDILESARADYPCAKATKAIRHRGGLVVEEYKFR